MWIIQWKELEVPVKMVNVLHGVHGTIRSVLPTEEMKQFLDALLQYAEKVINIEVFLYIFCICGIFVTKIITLDTPITYASSLT